MLHDTLIEGRPFILENRAFEDGNKSKFEASSETFGLLWLHCRLPRSKNWIFIEFFCQLVVYGDVIGRNQDGGFGCKWCRKTRVIFYENCLVFLVCSCSAKKREGWHTPKKNLKSKVWVSSLLIKKKKGKDLFKYELKCRRYSLLNRKHWPFKRVFVLVRKPKLTLKLLLNFFKTEKGLLRISFEVFRLVFSVNSVIVKQVVVKLVRIFGNFTLVVCLWSGTKTMNFWLKNFLLVEFCQLRD